MVELSIAAEQSRLLRLKQKRYREADEALTAAVELREKFAPNPAGTGRRPAELWPSRARKSASSTTRPA